MFFLFFFQTLSSYILHDFAMIWDIIQSWFGVWFDPWVWWASDITSSWQLFGMIFMSLPSEWDLCKWIKHHKIQRCSLVWIDLVLLILKPCSLSILSQWPMSFEHTQFFGDPPTSSDLSLLLSLGGYPFSSHGFSCQAFSRKHAACRMLIVLTRVPVVVCVAQPFITIFPPKRDNWWAHPFQTHPKNIQIRLVAHASNPSKSHINPSKIQLIPMKLKSHWKLTCQARHTGIHRFLHAALFALPKHQANSWWRKMKKPQLFNHIHISPAMIIHYAIWCHGNIGRKAFTIIHHLHIVHTVYTKVMYRKRERERERVGMKCDGNYQSLNHNESYYHMGVS